MTAPPEHLGAHHGSVQSLGEHQQLVQSIAEFLRLRMIGIRSESGMPPGQVVRRRLRVSPPAERGEPIPASANDVSKDSAENCGKRREPGKRLTSVTSSMSNAASTAMNS